MTNFDEKDIDCGLQAALNLAEVADIKWPRKPDFTNQRADWINNLKVGETVILHYLWDGHIETIKEQVIIHKITERGFFVLRDNNGKQGLLDIDKQGYVPYWGGKGWMAEL